LIADPCKKPLRLKLPCLIVNVTMALAIVEAHDVDMIVDMIVDVIVDVINPYEVQSLWMCSDELKEARSSILVLWADIY
jgi:hypothetical protein